MIDLALGLAFALSLSPYVVSGQHASSWHRPNDKSLSSTDLDAYHCGRECKQNLLKGIQTDRAGFEDLLFDADFYRTADSFTESSQPGDVLKVQSYINDTISWNLPGGATLYRVQYVSIGQDNKKVPATAFVTLPFANRPDNEPFPIVADAHGTIGTFYGCAPSSSYNLYDYDTWRPLYLAGYAVVATDYAGLGNNYTSHHHLASTLAAGDTYYSVIAAKKAFGSILGNKWASTGHSQGGGGHSPLSPLIGMGTDQVLSLEVVTCDGRFVTASESENSDLFWALRGGGAGTYGVVTSVTIKAYPVIPAATATWSFSYPANVTKDSFKQAMRAWLSYFPRYADMGLYSYLNVVPAPDGGRSFVMDPLVAPNKTLEEAKAIIQPWMDDVAELGIRFEPEWNHYDTFKGVADNALTNGSANNYGSVSGNRLFPRANFEGDLFDTTFDAMWKNVEEGYVVLPYNLAPAYDHDNPPDNAINPAWRESIAYVIMGTTIDYTQEPDAIMESRLNFTHGAMQCFRDVSPGSGSYGNEGDRLEPNFQWAYYGKHYPRLLELKKRFDPFDLFYAVTAVGSEFFEVRSIDEVANENGPLCKKADPILYESEGAE